MHQALSLYLKTEYYVSNDRQVDPAAGESWHKRFQVEATWFGTRGQGKGEGRGFLGGGRAWYLHMCRARGLEARIGSQHGVRREERLRRRIERGRHPRQRRPLRAPRLGGGGAPLLCCRRIGGLQRRLQTRLQPVIHPGFSPRHPDSQSCWHCKTTSG